MAKQRSFWTTSQGYAALALIGAVIYFLLMEHRAHLLQVLPFLILLLCPVMHIFMHGGHSGHKHSEETDSDAYRKGLEEGRRQNRENNPPSGGR